MYSKWTQIVQWFLFEFTDESEKLILNIGKDGHTSGKWTIVPIVSPPEVRYVILFTMITQSMCLCRFRRVL